MRMLMHMLQQARCDPAKDAAAATAGPAFHAQGVLAELRGISQLGNIERKVARQKGWRQRGNLAQARR